MSEGATIAPDGTAEGVEAGDGDEVATDDAGVAEADDGDGDDEGPTDDDGDDVPIDRAAPEGAADAAPPPQPATSSMISPAPEMRRQAEVVIAAV